MVFARHLNEAKRLFGRAFKRGNTVSWSEQSVVHRQLSQWLDHYTSLLRLFADPMQWLHANNAKVKMMIINTSNWMINTSNWIKNTMFTSIPKNLFRDHTS